MNKPKPAHISGIAADSRDVQKGFAFVATKGITHDGHDYIEEAWKKGAKVVYGERDDKEFKSKGINYIQVKDSREKLGELASQFYGNPSEKLDVIGVTGTKGKTTTVYIIHHILNELGYKAGMVTSIVAKIGDKVYDTGAHVTNPDVITLNKFLKEMVDNGCKYAVLEVSSHGIDQKRIAGIKFKASVLTNIAPEHLDYHKTFKEYKRVKMSFVNSTEFKVIAPKSSNLKFLPGEFNNIDAEAAIDLCLKMGMSEEEVFKAIKKFKLPSGRLEEINNRRGIKIFVDFAHTPESLEAALKYLRKITEGRVISVFGSAGERDHLKRPKMGKAASTYSDIVVLTAEDPRTEDVDEIINQIKNGIPNNSCKVFTESDRKKAIQMALDLSKKWDTVAIFGKGHEKTMNLNGKKEIYWSDQEIVRQYLK